MDFSYLFSNSLINIGIISWLTAQGFKTILDLIKHRRFNRKILSSSGGMPSSHSAITCSVLLTSYYIYGMNSPIFAVSFILAFIVMYDAMGVRWAAGLHAKALNNIVEYLERTDDSVTPADQRGELKEMIPKLNESLGHRVIEVVCGALLGFFIAVVGHYLRLKYFS